MSEETKTTAASAGEGLAKAYDPQAIEEKWAKYWVEERLFRRA